MKLLRLRCPDCSRNLADVTRPIFGGSITNPDWTRNGLLVTPRPNVRQATLLRQFGFQAAAGCHPFTLAPMPPVRVLLLDLENSAGSLRRKVRALADVAKPEPGHFRLEVRPQGLDLQVPADRAWLRQLVRANEPELLITGPIYKLTGGDPVKEEPAKLASAALDRLRVEQGCAVMLEAHVPYAANGARVRPIRPYGASLWSRCPEFGIHLAETGALTHWRGQRDERAWPAGLLRGPEWPWIVDPHAGSSVVRDALPPAASRVRDVLQGVRDYITVNDIGDRLAQTGRPLKRRTIQDALTRLGDLVDSLSLDSRGTFGWSLSPPTSHSGAWLPRQIPRPDRWPGPAPVNVAVGPATLRDYYETVTRAVGVSPVWDDTEA